MISDEILALATQRGVVTPEQADALRGLAQEAASRVPPPPPMPPPIPQMPPPLPARAADQPTPFDQPTDRQDDEALRFVTSFADIFVSLGLGLFFSSASYLLKAWLGTIGMWAALAVLAWLVAEFFSRRLRLALPSIILLGLFAASVFNLTTELVAALHPLEPVNWWHPTDHVSWLLLNAKGVAAAGVVTAALTGLHYWRFRVPITIAATVAAVIATVIGLIYWLIPDFAARNFTWLLLVAGISTFALAMRFDMTDLARKTRRTDIAFWLHLLAAPLIVHPLLATIVGRPDGPFTPFGLGALDSQSAFLVLAIFLGLGLVSLIIDRRALLVSGLTYAGLAFGTLLHVNGVDHDSAAITLLALGFFILFLSALWGTWRRLLLRLLPKTLVIRLPRSHLSAT